MFSDVLTFFEHTDLLSTAPLPTLLFKQKGGQVHHNKIGERMLNTLSGILGSAPIGIRPVLLPFLGSIVPAKLPVVSHRLVPPTRFNSAFSTKTIRLFGVHERTNLRVSKGIRLVNKAFLGSAMPVEPLYVVLAAVHHWFGTSQVNRPNSIVV